MCSFYFSALFLERAYLFTVALNIKYSILYKQYLLAFNKTCVYFRSINYRLKFRTACVCGVSNLLPFLFYFYIAAHLTNLTQNLTQLVLCVNHFHKNNQRIFISGYHYKKNAKLKTKKKLLTCFYLLVVQFFHFYLCELL